jgi:prepilin-type N-terminal cleavage/methylation domain-containing protein/prepilin-type processing-associated H-X9-DG protein
MKPAGFTLVELLVVISVIALLAALLFPVFHSSREQAKATACEANLRQLALALQAYEQNNLSFPYGFAGPRTAPPAGGYPGNPIVDAQGWWWFNLIEAVHYRTLRDMKAMQCPSKRLDSAKLKSDILCGNYGVNRALCKSAPDYLPGNEFEGSPLSLGVLRHPALTSLVMDSGYALICWWHAAKDPPVTFGSSIQDTAYVPGLEINKQKVLWPGQTRDAVAGRHPNRTVNIAFADFHIERKKARELLVEKTDDGAWNYSPLWSPE